MDVPTDILSTWNFYSIIGNAHRPTDIVQTVLNGINSPTEVLIDKTESQMYQEIVQNTLKLTPKSFEDLF